MVVVLPAPFGPMKPNISPWWTWKLMPSTAATLSRSGLRRLCQALHDYGIRHAHASCSWVMGVRGWGLRYDPPQAQT